MFGQSEKIYFYWKKNDKWYQANQDPYWGVELTDDAPEKAKKSFENWKDLILMFDQDFLTSAPPAVPAFNSHIELM